jgi:hypothetical protein
MGAVADGNETTGRPKDSGASSEQLPPDRAPLCGSAASPKRRDHRDKPGRPSTSAAPTTRQAFQATGTITESVRPVDAQGLLDAGYKVVKVLKWCKLHSGIAVRRRHRRCFAGNDIVDPCWPAAGPVPHVLCQFPPWGKTVWRLNLSTPLGAVTPFASPPAWGIELESGNPCGLAEGATDLLADGRVNYACNRNNVWLIGWTIRTHNPWSIPERLC